METVTALDASYIHNAALQLLLILNVSTICCLYHLIKTKKNI